MASNMYAKTHSRVPTPTYNVSSTRIKASASLLAQVCGSCATTSCPRSPQAIMSKFASPKLSAPTKKMTQAMCSHNTREAHVRPCRGCVLMMWPVFIASHAGSTADKQIRRRKITTRNLRRRTCRTAPLGKGCRLKLVSRFTMIESNHRPIACKQC